ncbi:RNA polymerase sigma factor [Candidatus Falkowbacteria bacterium]|jgi:RNA polymerase sigma-70 factor, ECF subfamily|nr:RNA polymerase sigma factor [Candidatus Falkowbacteria bacterium]MBT4433275.1 RNA polymerase sigma factor [Candidatus Falkowbacteria bacterium]
MGKIREKILITKIKAGDKEAFGEFYDLYVDKIYRFIYFKVSRVQEAEDLTSEVFLRVWQYARDGVEIENIKAFLYRVSRNAVIDFYRKNYGKETVDLEDHNIIDNLKADNLIEKIDTKAQVKEIIEKLDSIKEEYKEVILLRFVEEYSTKEIAEVMGRSKGATRVLLHRAMEALRSKVK